MRTGQDLPADTTVDVLVIDDNSPDGTADMARLLADELGGIRVVQREGKLGLGSAYRDGFRQVIDEGYDVVVSMDADLSHDPAVVPTMLTLLADGADVVVGSRYVPGGGTTDWPVRRQLLSRWGNAYTRTVLRLPVRDCTSGFRAYRASALAAIEPDSTAADGYAFLTELVRRASRLGSASEGPPTGFGVPPQGHSKMSGRISVERMCWG